LRLLALWVSKAHVDGFKGAHRDPLIGLGTAPLDDPTFRAAMFEQLGEGKLEIPVTTDICGKADAHAVRLDSEANTDIKRARLHRKVATTIFFESNGGQTTDRATMPEIRLAVGEPSLDTGNIETVIEALSPPNGACYYLVNQKSRYYFSAKPNLTKVLADRKANIQDDRIEECVRAEVQKAFAKGSGVDRFYFPKDSGQIGDKPVLTFVVLPPEQHVREKAIRSLLDSMFKNHGAGARVFKSALIFCLADDPAALPNEARKVLAWRDIQAQQHDLRLDESQKMELAQSLKQAERDLQETVWRSYNRLAYLEKDNSQNVLNLGMATSSSATSLLEYLLRELGSKDVVVTGVGVRVFLQNWPPAFVEWSTRSARDAFFSSPLFPRLLDANAIKATIAKAVESKQLGYVGEKVGGKYTPFYFGDSLAANEIEITDQMFLITKETAESYLAGIALPPPPPPPRPGGGIGVDGAGTLPPPQPPPPPPPAGAKRLSWSGEVPWQKWMNFYNRVLTRSATSKGLKLTLSVEVTPEGGVTSQQIEETKVALRELGLDDKVKAE